MLIWNYQFIFKCVENYLFTIQNDRHSLNLEKLCFFLSIASGYQKADSIAKVLLEDFDSYTSGVLKLI